MLYKHIAPMTHRNLGAGIPAAHRSRRGADGASELARLPHDAARAPAVVAVARLRAASRHRHGAAFEDPALQSRYERVIRELRCLVCRSETIADSNATLAADLRREVREMMAAGKSDKEILEYMTRALRRLRAVQAAADRAHLAAVVRAGAVAAARRLGRGAVRPPPPRRAREDAWDSGAGPT